MHSWHDQFLITAPFFPPPLITPTSTIDAYHDSAVTYVIAKSAIHSNCTHWKTRFTWDTRYHPADGTDADVDILLDVRTFVDAKKHLLHPKTREKVERIENDPDEGDRLFSRLAPMYEGLIVDHKTIGQVPNELAKEAIRSAAEMVYTDKCPV